MDKKQSCIIFTDKSIFGKKAQQFVSKKFDVKFSGEFDKSNTFDGRLIKFIMQSQCDWLLNFMWPTLVTDILLKFPKYLPINFHPAPPKYPGTGCASYAIYNGERRYGATAHIMNDKYDAGAILRVKYFKISNYDYFDDLFNKAVECNFCLFKEIINDISKGKKLIIAKTKWARIAYTRKDFKKFMTLTLDMPEVEVIKRVRAISHKTFPGPKIDFQGKEFFLLPRDE